MRIRGADEVEGRIKALAFGREERNSRYGTRVSDTDGGVNSGLTAGEVIRAIEQSWLGEEFRKTHMLKRWRVERRCNRVRGGDVEMDTPGPGQAGVLITDGARRAASKGVLDNGLDHVDRVELESKMS